MKNNNLCATRADVAKRAGVSVTIVSYVINNNRYVEKTKRERVLKAMEELHYQPSNIARALKGKSSNQIIFITDRITNQYFGELMRRMDEHASKKGYLISLCSNRNQQDFVREIINRKFDGVIISSISFPEKFIQQLIDAGVPVILLKNRDYKNVTGAGIIETGLYKGARQCVRYLYDKGRLHILYIDRISTHNHFSTLEDFRMRGFVDQMTECGLEHEGHIITKCTSLEEVTEKITRYMENHPVDALFGRNDRMACIGLQAVLVAGKRVPQDIAVIGFDNTDISKLTIPRLTTMEMQIDEIAKAAINMLYEMRTQAKVPEPVGFSARLIEREST